MGTVTEVLKKTSMYKFFEKLRSSEIEHQWTAHEQDMLEFYSQFVSAGDIVFDVGANLGNRSKVFLELETEVIAVEPQDACVKNLKSEHGKNAHFTIVQKVLGALEGEAELMISNENTISSLSQEWIDAVKSSGRFSESVWDNKQVVPMTTLDHLIKDYGTPVFIKIDVEGFEYDVIQGLSKSIRFISFEFVPEFIGATFKCIEYLQTLGEVIFNYSIGEQMQLALNEYVSSREMIEILENFVKHDGQNFGDVYCQFIS